MPLIGTSFAVAYVAKLLRGKSIVFGEDDWASAKQFWRLVTPFADFIYLMAVLLFGASVPLFACMVKTGNVPPINTLTFIFTAITGLQSLFFAMWFDMEYNKELR
jgi:hypothetical protein